MARKIKKKKAMPIPEAKGLKDGGVPRKKKIIIIAVSLSVMLALVAALVIGIIVSSREPSLVDYINDDLSEYVYISSEDYKDYPVDIPLIKADEDDVQRRIWQLLVANKDKEGQPADKSTHVIGVGDVVNIWYRGYVTDENGVKTELLGTKNFEKGEYDSLEIGSDAFIPGVEEGLIGKKLQKTSLRVVKNGKIEAGDVLYISCEAFLANGERRTETDLRIETAKKEEIDKIYGAGFTDYFIGKSVSEIKGESLTFKADGDSVESLYHNLSVKYAVRCSESPYLIDVVFPADYREKSYRGLSATFEIYVASATTYSVPEWSDGFITETLKESAEGLSAYEGVALTEKYESKIRQELKASAEDGNKVLIEEAMWEHYLSRAEFKKLPEANVEAARLKYLEELQLYYNIVGKNFVSLDQCARQYFGLSEDADWQEYIKSCAERDVREMLIFYYIIDKEALAPTVEEYESIYAEIKAEYMEDCIELYKNELEACKTEDERAAKLIEIEKEMLEYYGESYFRELVYREHALDCFIAFADLK